MKVAKLLHGNQSHGDGQQLDRHNVFRSDGGIGWRGERGVKRGEQMTPTNGNNGNGTITPYHNHRGDDDAKESFKRGAADLLLAALVTVAGFGLLGFAGHLLIKFLSK